MRSQLATRGPQAVAPGGIKLSDAEFEQVRAFAMRTSGISLGLSKKSLIVSRWSKRLAHHGLASFRDYLALLGAPAGGQEAQIALDLLTTNETSFFREAKHFDFIRDKVLPQVKRDGRFRLWSAACSTGEEPYTAAMVLATHLPHGNWEVVGTDISSRVLATARNGLYELPRAASIPPDFLRRFCLKGTGPHANQFLIARELRDRVRFSSANLNAPLGELGLFDVVLLRNVMIYFDSATKSRVLQHLVPTIQPGGYLIIGHCDTLAGVEHGLVPCGPSLYRKAAA